MSDDNPWDDAAFKTRVREAAAQRGMPLREALLAAGVSRGHLDKSGEGRSTSTILRLARVLDVSPNYLFLLDDEAEPTGATSNPWRLASEPTQEKIGRKKQDKASASGNHKSRDRDKRLSMYTKIIAAQLAAQFATLVCMASDNSDEESAKLMDFVLQVIDHVSDDKRGGNGV